MTLHLDLNFFPTLQSMFFIGHWRSDEYDSRIGSFEQAMAAAHEQQQQRKRLKLMAGAGMPMPGAAAGMPMPAAAPGMPAAHMMSAGHMMPAAHTMPAVHMMPGAHMPPHMAGYMGPGYMAIPPSPKASPPRPAAPGLTAGNPHPSPVHGGGCVLASPPGYSGLPFHAPYPAPAVHHGIPPLPGTVASVRPKVFPFNVPANLGPKGRALLSNATPKNPASRSLKASISLD